MAPRVSVYRPQLRVPVLEAPRIQEVDVSSGVLSAANDLEQTANRMRAGRLNEAKLNAAKQLEELEFEAEKQPWETRAKFFNDSAARIRGEIEKASIGSDRALRDAFGDAWGQMYLPRSSQVRYSARKGEIDHNLAVLDESMTVYARQAAQAGDERQASFIKDQAAVAIADAKTAGFLTDVDAGDRLRDFARGVERNRARALIEANPITGLKALQDTGQFMNLREEDRLMLVDRAQSELQHRAAMADAAANRAERARRIMGDQVAKDGWDLVTKGQMTDAWLNENKATLDSNDYKALLTATQAGGGKDQSDALVNLYEKIYVTGEDVGGDVVQGLRDKLFSPETAAKLLDENKQTQGVKSPARSAREYIATSLKPGELNPAVGAPERLAGAIAEFDEFMRLNSKASAVEVDKRARDIVKRYWVINKDQITLTLPAPRFAVGERNAYDIPKTKAAIAKAYLAKHGGDKTARDRDPEYVKELRNLKLWSTAQDQARRAAEAAKQAEGNE